MFRRNAADDCPAETEWTVKNLDSWVTVKNFARCQGENYEDQQAFKLSYTVCDLIQETEGKNLGDRMRNSLQKRKNTLCNRAMNHARVSFSWLQFETFQMVDKKPQHQKCCLYRIRPLCICIFSVVDFFDQH